MSASILDTVTADYEQTLAAQVYLDEGAFAARGMAVEWIGCAGLPEYPQLWGDFEPAVSVLDPILALGADGARAVLGA